MRLEDYEKKIFEEVQGLYDHGEKDQVPEDHFSDCLNIDYEAGQWETRSGLTPAITLGYGAGNGRVRRTSSFPTAFGKITLILDNAGNLYTSSIRAGDNATNVRISNVNATDFSAIQMLGKIFISFHNGMNGLAGELIVFIPASTVAGDEFRNAAGAAPASAGAMGAADGAAGGVIAGNYKIAVAYITTTGFITQPGPKVITNFTPTLYAAPGSKKIDLSFIPTGPAGTAKRQILITKVNGEEYFFLPEAFGGLINNNVATTTTLDFNSITDLVDSADYLFDILEVIPAPLVMLSFKGHLVIAGEFNNTSIMRLSKHGDVETFDQTDGIIIVSKDDGFGITNLFSIRNVLYTVKELGIYASVDNGLEPVEWGEPVAIDRSVGTVVHGISSFYNMSDARLARDWTLIVDKSGILFMDGAVRKPPITAKIDNIWQRINFSYFHKTVLIADERHHKIYCSIVVDSGTENNMLLVADYNECGGNLPEADKIKWTIWEFKPGGLVRSATDISLTTLDSETVPSLKMASIDGGGKVWKLDDSVQTDDGTDYESNFETALLYWNNGYIHTFVAVRLRIVGEDSFISSVRGEDNTNPADLPIVDLSTLPGKELMLKLNFQNEKGRFKFRSVAGNFVVSKLEVFGIPTYPMRPA